MIRRKLHNFNEYSQEFINFSWTPVSLGTFHEQTTKVLELPFLWTSSSWTFDLLILLVHEPVLVNSQFLKLFNYFSEEPTYYVSVSWKEGMSKSYQIKLKADILDCLMFLLYKMITFAWDLLDVAVKILFIILLFVYVSASFGTSCFLVML